LGHDGRNAEGVPRLQRCRAQPHRHVLPRVAVEAGYWLAQSLALMGALVTAEEVAGEAGRLAARAGDVPRTRYRVARAEANVAIERGHPEAALARLEREAADEPNEHQRIAF